MLTLLRRRASGNKRRRRATRPVIVLAHAGHWLVGRAYFSPMLVLVALITVGKLRDRRD